MKSASLDESFLDLAGLLYMFFWRNVFLEQVCIQRSNLFRVIQGAESNDCANVPFKASLSCTQRRQLLNELLVQYGHSLDSLDQRSTKVILIECSYHNEQYIDKE